MGLAGKRKSCRRLGAETPPPDWWVEAEDGLTRILWADQLIDGKKELVAINTEEERRRTTHYEGDFACDCEKCNPEKWKEKAAAAAGGGGGRVADDDWINRANNAA